MTVKGTRAILLGALSLVGAVAVSGQSVQGLKAREIFYGDAAAPPARLAAPSGRAPAKPGAQNAATPKRVAPKNNPQPGPTPSVASAGSAAAGSPAAVSAVKTNDVPFVSTNRNDAPNPDRAPVQLVSESRRALGIRLGLIRLNEKGQPEEVDTDSVFHAKDRVRLNIRVSDKGYLYVINRGSSGTWTQLFPSPDLPEATNEVLPGVDYSVPPGHNFVVSDPPGEEKLFVILSRTPQLDVEALTLDMSRRSGSDAPREKPAADPPSGGNLMAMNLPPISDAAVARLRNSYARDLIIEKVDEQTPGERREQALYVVNPAASDQSRVVLDFQIKHR